MCAVERRSGGGLPISVVVRRTGLTQDLLRAWEKRYRAVVPLRTATGRRLYTEEQVVKLRRLKQLVDGGRRISDVAELDVAALQALADEDASEAVTASPPAVRRATNGLLMACLEAVDRLDRGELERALEGAAVALSRPRLRAEVLAPLIAAVGQRWQDGTWRVAHEHLATAVLRAFLWSLWRRVEAGPGAPAAVVATPAGQMHELGVLLAAGIAADMGWRVVYLGADLPAEEIALAVASSGASAIVLSLVYPLADPRLLDELKRLRGLVGPRLVIDAGGRAAAANQETLAAAGIRGAGDLEALGAILGETAS